MYLQPTSNYTAARDLTIQAARDLFGIGSCQEVAATDAWYAVGVGQPYFTGPLSITGDNIFCSTSNLYTINNLPNGLAVQWQATPSGVVTINSPNSPQTTLTKGLDGIITLTATITVCPGTIPVTKQITVGVPTFGIQADVPCQPGRIVQSSRFTVFPISNVPTTYHWRAVQNGISTTILGTGPSVSKKFPIGGPYQVYAWGQNACGSGDEAVVNFNVVSCPNGPQIMVVSPNPATNTVTVSVNEEQSGENIYTGFDEIRLYDFQGNLKKYQKFNQAKTATINISGFRQGLYLIEITSGTYKERQQLIIQE